MSSTVDTLDHMLRERGRSVTALSISIFLRGLQDHAPVITHLEQQRSLPGADLYTSVHLVQIHCWRGERDRAEAIARETIDRFSDTSLPDLLKKIERALRDGRIIGSSFVSYPDSTMQNLGFFEHVVEERGTGRQQVLLTKLTTRELSGTEHLFYELARKPGTRLAEVAPQIIDLTLSGSSDLCFLTMEKVPGSALVVQDMTDAEVDAFIRTYGAIAEVDRVQVAPVFTQAAFEIGHSHAYLVSALQKVHEAACFERINNWLVESVRTRGYSPQVARMIEDMVVALQQRSFQQQIDPAAHYGLLHGDLHRFNVIGQAGMYKIIDWGKCTVGPKGIDLAVLFRRFPFSRHLDIMERNGLWTTYALENRILFAYALLVVSVMIDIKEIKTEPEEQLFRPATDFIVRALS